MTAALFPIGYEFHLEVWILVLTLTLVGVYVAKVLAPKLGKFANIAPIRRRQKLAFGAAMVMLWVASDWPMHDISESYLYSIHMIQHIIITLIVPPLLWIAMPEWFARLLIGQNLPSVSSRSSSRHNLQQNGSLQNHSPGSSTSENGFAENGFAGPGKNDLEELPNWLKRIGHPVAAGLLFNALVAITHIPFVVNTSVDNGSFHYLIHLGAFTAAMVMWLPICGPFQELRLRPPGQMVYLFVMSLLPTIPAAFLTFANRPIYSGYETETRLWGISVISDQQAAGLVMKLLAGIYLWALIGYIFFKWTLKQEAKREAEQVAKAAQRDRLFELQRSFG